MAATHQQGGAPLASLPVVNGISGVVTPSAQGLVGYPVTSGAATMQPAGPQMNGTAAGSLPQPATAAQVAAAGLQPAGAGNAASQESCARSRLWGGPGQGSVRPERLQCAAYGGPVIANGDGTVANWLGLHGWQPVRTAGAKRQASGFGQQGQQQQHGGRGKRDRSSRPRDWDASDVSYSGSDSEESDVSSVPSERGRGTKQDEAASPDPERPELNPSDEDSEYEAMRRAKERRVTGRGRRVAARSRETPPPAQPRPARKKPRHGPKRPKAAAAAAADVPPAPDGGAPPNAPAAAHPTNSAQPAAAPAASSAAAAAPPPQQQQEQQQPAATAAGIELPAASGLLQLPPEPEARLQSEAEEMQEAQEGEEEEEEEEEEDEPQAEPVVLERGLSDEQKQAERMAVRSSPDFATILDFLQVFRELLRLGRRFGAAELEAVLVASPGDDGLLPEIHMDLLRGMNQRILVDNSNWARHVARRLLEHWRERAIWKFSDPPFLVAKDEDAAVVYSQLPSLARVAALKALCEMRLDKDDLRGAIDAAAGPRRRLKKGEVDDSATLDDFRRAPLGRDAAGRAYWLHDFFDTTGLRLYREAPAGGNTPAASKDTVQPQPEDPAAAPAAADAHRSDASAPGSPAASTGAGGAAAEDANAGTAAAEQENRAEDTSQAALPPAGSTADAAGDTSAGGADAGSDASGSGDGGLAFGAALEAPSAASAAKLRSAAARAAAEAAAAAEAVAAAEAAAAAAAAAPAKSRARGKASRSRAPRFNPPGSHVADVEEGGWVCVATSVEELESLGAELALSAKHADQELSSLILDEVVPAAEEAAAAAQRRVARRERLQRDLATAAVHTEGYGRSQRQRKQVDYTYNDYNETILDAVRGPREPEEPIPAWALDAEDRPSAAELVAAGLRRGRSHRDASLAFGLPDERMNGRSRSRTPAVSAAPSGDDGDSDAEAAAQHEPEQQRQGAELDHNHPQQQQQPQQQQTSRLWQVTGPPSAPQVSPQGSLGAPSLEPPAQLELPIAAAPQPATPLASAAEADFDA